MYNVSLCLFFLLNRWVSILYELLLFEVSAYKGEILTPKLSAILKTVKRTVL